MKILIAEPIHPIMAQRLTDNGCSVTYQPETDRNKLRNTIAEYEGLVIRSRFIINKALLKEAKQLKFVARAGSGIENIDTKYAQTKGITVFNSPEGNSNAVGEHALGMLLSLLHNISKSNTEVKSGIWNRKANQGTELSGKTIGIIGYGNTGGMFAKRVQGFDVNVLAYDKYKHNFSDKYVTECSLTDIYKKADIVSFHVPLSKETNDMGNSHFFSKFSKEFIVINTSRGSVINTGDLVSAIEQKKVLGAGLDVLEFEKHSFESVFNDRSAVLKRLTEFPNVVLSPHIAGSTKESVFKIADVLAGKIITKYGASRTIFDDKPGRKPTKLS